MYGDARSLFILMLLLLLLRVVVAFVVAGGVVVVVVAAAAAAAPAAAVAAIPLSQLVRLQPRSISKRFHHPLLFRTDSSSRPGYDIDFCKCHPTRSEVGGRGDERMWRNRGGGGAARLL